MGRVRDLILSGQTGGQMLSITEVWFGEESKLSFQSTPLSRVWHQPRESTLCPWMSRALWMAPASRRDRQTNRPTNTDTVKRQSRDRRTDTGECVVYVWQCWGWGRGGGGPQRQIWKQRQGERDRARDGCIGLSSLVAWARDTTAGKGRIPRWPGERTAFGLPK